jgi:hypothetical protein
MTIDTLNISASVPIRVQTQDDVLIVTVNTRDDLHQVKIDTYPDLLERGLPEQMGLRNVRYECGSYAEILCLSWIH